MLLGPLFCQFADSFLGFCLCCIGCVNASLQLSFLASTFVSLLFGDLFSYQAPLLCSCPLRLLLSFLSCKPFLVFLCLGIYQRLLFFG